MFTPMEMCDVWYALSTTLDGAKKNLEKEPTNLNYVSIVCNLEPLEKKAHDLMNGGRNKEGLNGVMIIK